MEELSEFAKIWKDRYMSGTATYNHLERLKAIEKLTEQEFKLILIAKRIKDKSK